MYLHPTRVLTISTQCDCSSWLLVTHFATRWSHSHTLQLSLGFGRRGNNLHWEYFRKSTLPVSSVTLYLSFFGVTPLENSMTPARNHKSAALSSVVEFCHRLHKSVIVVLKGKAHDVGVFMRDLRIHRLLLLTH